MVRVIGVKLGLRSSTGADEGPGLRGWGKLSSCTGASTTKGPPQKNSKNYYLKFINSFFVFRLIYFTKYESKYRYT